MQLLNKHAIKRLKERYDIEPNEALCRHLQQCILNRNKHRKLLYHDIELERFVYQISARKHCKGLHKYFVIVTDKNRDSIKTFLPEDWMPSNKKLNNRSKIVNEVYRKAINELLNKDF